MNYAIKEKGRAVMLRDAMTGDPGGGIYHRHPRDFVLADPTRNLWNGVRAEAIRYFANNKISWHRSGTLQPPAHLLSSQVACVNHLFALRHCRDLATAVLHGIDKRFVEAEIVDDGYVEFEFIGSQPLLGERSFSRGSHCTSIDACMVGRLEDGGCCVVLIEWKYVERYRRHDLYLPARARIYDRLIVEAISPFSAIDPKVLYYEPFYQLMRQTLFGSLLTRTEQKKYTSWLHVHVAPAGNVALLTNITAPELYGANISEAWRHVLKRPELYVAITPEELLAPLALEAKTAALLTYLRQRYWIGG